MRKPIARLRIAAGNPGWYDPLTNIHLTITKPEDFVYEGQNVSNIKKAIAHKLLYVVEGELNPIKPEVIAPIIKKEKIVEEVREVVPEEPKQVVEEVEEIKEEVVIEEEVAEKKPAKKPAKKTTKKKAE